MSEPVRVVVYVEGGVIQDIETCGVAVDVAVIDFDTEGSDPLDIVRIPHKDGGGYDNAITAMWTLRFADKEAAKHWQIVKLQHDAPPVTVPRDLLNEMIAYIENSTLENDPIPPCAKAAQKLLEPQ